MSWGTFASLKNVCTAPSQWCSDTLNKVSVCFHGYFNFDFLCSVVACAANKETSQGASAGTVWIYKLTTSSLLGNHLGLDHWLGLYTSGGPTLAFDGHPWWFSLEERSPRAWSTSRTMWSLSACLDPDIIIDVTMVSSAEILWYFRPSRETQKTSGFLFTFSQRVFLWKWKGNAGWGRKVRRKKKNHYIWFIYCTQCLEKKINLFVLWFNTVHIR